MAAKDAKVIGVRLRTKLNPVVQLSARSGIKKKRPCYWEVSDPYFSAPAVGDEISAYKFIYWSLSRELKKNALGYSPLPCFCCSVDFRFDVESLLNTKFGVRVSSISAAISTITSPWNHSPLLQYNKYKYVPRLNYAIAIGNQPEPENLVITWFGV